MPGNRLPALPKVLLQVKPFPHEPLQAGFVEDVVGEFFVGKHGESGALGSGHQFRSFFDGKIRVLADDRHHHVDHHLQAADLLPFLQSLVWLRIFHHGKGPAHSRYKQLKRPLAGSHFSVRFTHLRGGWNSFCLPQPFEAINYMLLHR